MKKLSVLLMSLATVASVSAAPVVKKGHDTFTVKEVAAIKQAKAQKSENVKLNAVAPKQAVKASYKNLAFPLQQKNYAAAATIDFTATEIAGAYYYASDNDWYLTMYNADRSYRLHLDLVNTENPGQLEGVYTENDVLANYTELADLLTQTYYYFETLNVTVTGNDPQGDVTIVGEGVTADGETISINVSQRGPLEPTSIVEINDGVANTTFGELTTMVITSPTSDVTLNLVYSGISGSFKTANFDKTNSYAVNNGVVSMLDNAEMTVAIDENKNMYVSAFVVTEDAVGYQVVAQETLPVLGNVEISANNLSVDDLFGFYYFLDASTEEYPFIEALLFEAPVAGDFTDEVSINLKDAADNDIAALIIDKAVITNDENGGIVFDAEFYGSDLKQYTLHMYHELPAIANVVDMDFVGELDDITTGLGAFQIMAMNAENTHQISLVYDAYTMAEGEYNEISEYYKSYNAMWINNEKFQIEWAKGNLTLTDDTFTFVGSCQVWDTQYNFNITGEFVPEGGGQGGNDYDDADNDLEIVYSLDDITEYEFDPEYGYVYIAAMNDDNQETALVFQVEGEDLEEGVYTIDASMEPGTVWAGEIDATQGYVYPSFIANLDEEGYLMIPLWLIVDGTVTVKFDEDGNPSIEVEATNTWGREAHVVINPIEDNPTAIETVATKAAKTGKFMENNSVVIRTAARQYNAFGQIAK